MGLMWGRAAAPTGGGIAGSSAASGPRAAAMAAAWPSSGVAAASQCAPTAAIVPIGCPCCTDVAAAATGSCTWAAAPGGWVGEAVVEVAAAAAVVAC